MCQGWIWSNVTGVPMSKFLGEEGNVTKVPIIDKFIQKRVKKRKKTG